MYELILIIWHLMPFVKKKSRPKTALWRIYLVKVRAVAVAATPVPDEAVGVTVKD